MDSQSDKKIIPNKLMHLSTIFIFFIFINVSVGQTLSEAMDNYENMQYDIAIKTFNKVWKKDKTDNEINYMYGKCILRANTDRTKAIKHLEIVIGNDINYKDVNFELAKAYTYKHEFNKAKQVLNFFLKNYDFSEETAKKNEIADKDK